MVSKAINMDKPINSMVSKINRYHRNSIKYYLHKERNLFSYDFVTPETEEKYYKEITMRIDKQWTKQLQQTFYYQNHDSEQISWWMLRMMRDRTSFWFDEISYEQIRNDYKEVKQNYLNFIEDKYSNAHKANDFTNSQFDIIDESYNHEQEEKKHFEKFVSPKRKQTSKRKLTEQAEDIDSFKIHNNENLFSDDHEK